MKNVLKSSEPEALVQYRGRFSKQFRRWTDLKRNRATHDAIRQTLVVDQKGLCAYCEMALHPRDQAVEHIIPCHQSTLEQNHDLDWQNMLATCLGGLQNVDIPGEDNIRNSKPPNNFPCCGAAKKDHIPDGQLLNPLKLPSIRLFKFSSRDGEIQPDEEACEQAGILPGQVQFTIEQLRLNVPRLKDQRLAIIEEINQELDELDDGSVDPTQLEQDVAIYHFGDGLENWPRFFTTIRWVLGEGAERHLQTISYSG